MALSEFLITPKDFGAFIKYLSRRVTRKSFAGSLGVISIIAFLWMTSTLTFASVVFFVILFATLFWNWDAAVPLGLALASLMVVFMFLLLDNFGFHYIYSSIRSLANWSFGFMVIGVIKLLLEYVSGFETKTITPVEQIKNNLPAMKKIINKRTRRILW